MDPNACYARWQSAIQAQDLSEAREAKADLSEWLANGGEPPAWTHRERRAFFDWSPNRIKVAVDLRCDACGHGTPEQGEYLCRACKPRTREGRI